MQLKEIVKRHELTEKYLPTLEPKLALAEAHQDRAYLLELVEKLQSMLADITDCSCETCIKKEHCVFFELYVLSKLESEGGEEIDAETARKLLRERRGMR
jgi:hypothetical protein